MGLEVYQCWCRTAKKHPSRVAIREPGGTETTFAELAAAVSRNLESLGQAGDWKHRIVAFQIGNSSLWMEAFLTCQAAQAIALPIDPDIPQAGLAAIVKDLKPAAFWNADGISSLPGSSRKSPACLVKLTSGSTGQPSALVFSDKEMLADGNQVCRTMGIHSADTNLAIIPFGHSYGLGNLVMPLIQRGAPVAICREAFPHRIATAIAETGSTVVPAVPAVLNALARADLNPRRLDPVRLWISAGSPLAARDARLFEAAFGKRIHNFYGSSETGGIAYDRTGEETLRGLSVGPPLDGVKVETTSSGRLRVTSPAVYRRHNRLRTGGMGSHIQADLGQVLEDGRIVLLGRRTRMVKIGGKRLNLTEVEKRILETPGVDQVHVRDYRDHNGRTRLACLASPELSVGLIREQLRKTLPAWKIPDRWIFLPALPLTARGKPDNRAMQEILARRIRIREKQ